MRIVWICLHNSPDIAPVYTIVGRLNHPSCQKTPDFTVLVQKSGGFLFYRKRNGEIYKNIDKRLTACYNYFEQMKFYTENIG